MADKISLSDVEDSIRGIQRSANGSLNALRPAFPGFVGVAAGLLVFIAFVAGYRRGRNKTSVIEITRL
ncbi:hypothetical protein [Ferrimicrobium acidiphilum]|jgi:hypothetical protein|uniref:Uncharacterized protein n=1 Tax=Ferrimicrobium acidiphilum DSM 19497 TaxID=1121877 RepID=A0A0D8FXJ5_9ACTN|nr:hypothetical protein [Ferrimicrobium acidiphilum]KJE77861.1 hypothetical protein FEAC_02330 [Ferrimicrobium acidiphilum DSM 19497]MCL5053329.1 hypothetical protein [Gammaproteobacteria bacterium]